jgi:hypothetical protein
VGLFWGEGIIVFTLPLIDAFQQTMLVLGTSFLLFRTQLTHPHHATFLYTNLTFHADILTIYFDFFITVLRILCVFLLSDTVWLFWCSLCNMLMWRNKQIEVKFYNLNYTYLKKMTHHI